MHHPLSGAGKSLRLGLTPQSRKSLKGRRGGRPGRDAGLAWASEEMPTARLAIPPAGVEKGDADEGLLLGSY